MHLKALVSLSLLLTGVAAACSSDNGADPGPGSGEGGTGASGGTAGAGDEAGTSGSAASGGTSGSGAGGSSGGSTGGSSSAGEGNAGEANAGAEAGGSAGVASGGAAGEGPNPPECGIYGDLCETGDDCCSNVCDADTNTCDSAITQCAEDGADCSAPTDCCTLVCDGGTCGDTACISDGGECTDSADCCGGDCSDGACVALNPSCKTSGNECESDGECCSKACDDGRCSLSVSWCIQPGDICSRGSDCCTAECVIADGATVGTCGAVPEGPSFCGGVDGMACDGCNGCCSRLCAPGPSGRTICQPASGCHVTGDLCRQDSDCCGGDPDSGLPGAGNVICEIEPGRVLGICRNPMSCNPQGNVCHYENYACDISSARANCCGALGASSNGCQLDALGVPRCNGLGDDCRPKGETCASAADCCDDIPCVPDSEGVLRCADIPDDEPPCVPSGGNCTINGDCCVGSTCIRPVGSIVGVCGEDTPPGTGGTGGTGGTSGAGGTSGTAGTSGAGGTGGTPPSCAEYGQLCEGNSDCCNEVPCAGGICRYAIP